MVAPTPKSMAIPTSDVGEPRAQMGPDFFKVLAIRGTTLWLKTAAGISATSETLPRPARSSTLVSSSDAIAVAQTIWASSPGKLTIPIATTSPQAAIMRLVEEQTILRYGRTTTILCVEFRTVCSKAQCSVKIFHYYSIQGKYYGK